MKRLTVIFGSLFIVTLLLITILITNKKNYITDKSKIILYEDFNNKLKDFDRIIFSNNSNKYEIIKEKKKVVNT